MGAAQAPPPGVIQVTPEEKAAIERVCIFLFLLFRESSTNFSKA